MRHEKTLSFFYFSSAALSTLHLLLFCLICSVTTSSFASSNETDRIALLEFKHRISSDDLLNSWNESVHHCGWQGVSCGHQHRRVVGLELPEMGLVGTISPHIGNLTFLRVLHLHRNMLHGEIPGEIGGLFRLRDLDLSTNALTGEMAKLNLSSCVHLRILDFAENGLQGNLPTVNLKKLQVLSLRSNRLTGGIPPTFGNFSSLETLGLEWNHLKGHIPHEITRCWGLNILSLGANNFTGTLSPFFNMTSIQIFSVTENSLEGTFPSNIGDTMPNLEGFYFCGNKFHGTIPISFPNASKLQLLLLSNNHLVGKVPDNIGMLTDLVDLNLEKNLLGSSNDPLNNLAFITSLSNCSNLNTFSIAENRFKGKLPNTIANLSSKLHYLYLGENKIFGTIPGGIKNLVSLIAFGAGFNLLSGIIPSEIGELHKLQLLSLGENQLSGKMPLTLFNLTSLALLALDNNNFDGNIPLNVENFQHLNEWYMNNNKLDGTIPQQVFYLPSLSKFLDLSRNSFIGPLSSAVGKLKALNALDISGNKLSSQIPDTIRDCLSLEYLDMHDNLFEGKVPPMVSLKSIIYLDISNNKLTGEIPRDLQKLPLLQYLNLSFNDLEGEVPTIGVFAVATNVSLLGNKKLCGGIPELKLPPCPVKKTKHRKHLKLMIVIFTCIFSALLFASFIAFLTFCWRKQKRVESAKPSKVEKLSKISYRDLHQATDGFSETNLIGSGSFGSVYKGRYEQGGGEQTIAVKILDLLKNGASKSFLTECKVLRNIRHRNLVPILTCCSSCDFAGNEFKALVYEFMENGDLDTWLHTHSSNARTTVLSVLQRLNIAIDIASALNYLHDDCESMVIHCDIKPSNILLDKDLTAHVGDFGISRLYSCTIGDPIGEQSSTIGLKGSTGYVPPEYGIGAKASTFGDVYSFGILLLEMFIAKRPTDALFINGGCESLYGYVEAALSEQVMHIVDPLLIACLQSNLGIRQNEELENDGNLVEIEESKMHNFFISIFKIGLACASRSPMDRMHMNEVSRELNKIKKAFFA